MSRPSNRRGHVVGAAYSPATQQHDHRLDAGVVYNDMPSKLGEGDESTSLLRLRCSCGQVVGVVWFVLPPANSGRAALYMAEVQAVDKVDIRPVRAQTARVDLLEVEQLLADCTADGRIIVNAKRLIDRAREHLADVPGESKMGTLNVIPEGLPVGHDLKPPTRFRSGAEFREWWDRHAAAPAD